MEIQAAFAGILNLSTFSSLLVALTCLYVILTYIIFPSSKRKSLPPGPRPWPIIGNTHQIGNLPHAAMARFSKAYGPIISLKLGSQLAVIASSPTAATEILKKQDRFLCARNVPLGMMYEHVDLDSQGLLWATKCEDGWRSLRALFRNELFSAKAIESQTILRVRKVEEMVENLRKREGQAVVVEDVVFTAVFDTLTNLIFSKDFIGSERNAVGLELKRIMAGLADYAVSPNISDLYPVLAGLDLQGMKKKMTKLYEELCAVFDTEVNKRREGCDLGRSKRDFLDVFLTNGFQNHQINWLIQELFIAGTETSVSTVEWAMTQLLKNKEAMNKVCEELQREIGKNQLTEADAVQLPYLDACVKETLRLHPPAPLLVPRRALETCKVMNYTIPKDSQVFVNVWAIGRDPSVWEDPLSFKPDRFLNSNLDYKGQYYEYLPFGAGRRICPGLPLAIKHVPFILGTLLHNFDWSLADGEELDMGEKFGVVLQKAKHLVLVPHQKF